MISCTMTEMDKKCEIILFVCRSRVSSITGRSIERENQPVLNIFRTCSTFLFCFILHFDLATVGLELDIVYNFPLFIFFTSMTYFTDSLDLIVFSSSPNFITCKLRNW